MSLIKQAIYINLTFSPLPISMQYQAHSVRNKEKYQLRDYQLIPLQILQTNIIRIVWKSKENY